MLVYYLIGYLTIDFFVIGKIEKHTIIYTKRIYTVIMNYATVKNYGSREKEVKTFGNGAHVTVPRGWMGKKVKVLLIEPLEETE